MATAEYVEALNVGFFFRRGRQSDEAQSSLIEEFDGLTGESPDKPEKFSTHPTVRTTIRPPSWKAEAGRRQSA